MKLNPLGVGGGLKDLFTKSLYESQVANQMQGANILKTIGMTDPTDVAQAATLFNAAEPHAFGAELLKLKDASTGAPVFDKAVLSGLDDATATVTSDFGKAMANPFLSAKKGGGLGTTLELLKGNIKAHPFKAGAMAASGLGNIAGLFDNEQVGGQLGGAALGGLLAATLGGNWGLYGKIMAPMLGGNLGALFDKLREKQAAEQQQAEQYAQMAQMQRLQALQSSNSKR